MVVKEKKQKTVENKKYIREIMGKIAIAIGLFVVLMIIPFTRTTIVSLIKFSWFMLLWILLLFAVIFVIRWIILRAR